MLDVLDGVRPCSACAQMEEIRTALSEDRRLFMAEVDHLSLKLQGQMQFKEKHGKLIAKTNEELDRMR